jgi:LPXTG-motif cell wall-anchored protein
LIDSVGGNGLVVPGVTLPEAPVSDLLGELGSLVPACGAVLEDVQQLAPQAVGGFPGLLSPVTFKAASVNSVSSFKTVAAPTQTTTPNSPPLPRTGMNETLLLIVGGLMAAAALGVRRISADPERVRIR